MNLLAFDTATEACSVALLVGDALTFDYVETPRDHSRLILKMIDSLLVAASIVPRQLDGLAFGRGPGSFTGVRIGAGAAQGIALAIDCPVVPVSNLAAIAQRTYRELGEERVLTAIDARMGEVYWGAYRLDRDGLMCGVIDECVRAPESVPLVSDRSASWMGAGTGWHRYAQVLTETTRPLRLSGFVCQLPHARDILHLAEDDFRQGKGVAAELAQPVYLRDKVAKTVTERRTR